MKSEKRISRICKIPAMAVLTLALSILIVMIPAKVAHASGIVRFGSANYTPAANSDFQVGVYIETTDEIPLGTYSVNITYDPALLTYVSGAETGGDGALLVMGASLDGKQGVHMLTFHANGTPGDTALTVTGAVVNDTTGVAMEVGGLPAAPISIQTATTRMPEYIRFNDKEVAGLTEGQTEYTFSIPYAESFTIEVPEGFTVIFDYPEDPHPGRNNVTAVISQPNANPLTLTLHANMEPKEEEVVEPEPEPESDSEPVSEVTSESTELPMEPVVTSEEITSEPEEIASEPVSEGKSTREGGFPPNNQIHYEFKTSDLYWIGGCILGALLLFVLILLIVNGRSVGEGDDDDDDEDYDDEDEEDEDEDDGWEPLDMDTPPAKPVKKDEPNRKDSNKKDFERNDSTGNESGKKSSKKEGSKKSDNTKTGDDLVAATYKKDSKKAVGDEIVAATYKKGGKKNDSEDEEADENKRSKEERAKEKEERAQAKEQAKEERLKEKEERTREKEEREAEKEERAREKEERAQAKEQAKEERLKEKEERAREKEEREAEKEERAREKEERAQAKEQAKEERLREKEEQAKAKEEQARIKEEQAREREEREKAKETAREEQLRAKEERAKAKAKEPEYYEDDATGELSFLPLDYTEEDLRGITNADEEDNIVGTAELVRSEEIADFDDDMADAISAATENEIKETAKAKAEENEAVAYTRAILAGTAAAEPFAKTLIMDPEELKKQLLEVTEDDPRYKGGAEEYEAYGDEEEDEEWEDEDGFIDLESSVSDRKSKH